MVGIRIAVMGSTGGKSEMSRWKSRNSFKKQDLLLRYFIDFRSRRQPTLAPVSPSGFSPRRQTLISGACRRRKGAHLAILCSVQRDASPDLRLDITCRLPHLRVVCVDSIARSRRLAFFLISPHNSFDRIPFFEPSLRGRLRFFLHARTCRHSRYAAIGRWFRRTCRRSACRSC